MKNVLLHGFILTGAAIVMKFLTGIYANHIDSGLFLLTENQGVMIVFTAGILLATQPTKIKSFFMSISFLLSIQVMFFTYNNFLHITTIGGAGPMVSWTALFIPASLTATLFVASLAPFNFKTKTYELNLD